MILLGRLVQLGEKKERVQQFKLGRGWRGKWFEPQNVSCREAEMFHPGMNLNQGTAEETPLHEGSSAPDVSFTDSSHVSVTR